MDDALENLFKDDTDDNENDVKDLKDVKMGNMILSKPVLVYKHYQKNFQEVG